jgi:hypothetical protein
MPIRLHNAMRIRDPTPHLVAFSQVVLYQRS